MTRSFDAVVVGSGLGGLVAGAIYARSGRRVLVLEKNASFGGALGVYKVDGLTVEASLHELDGLDEDDPKLAVMRSVGLDDLDYISVGDLYEARSPLLGEPFVMPAGVEPALDATSRRFAEHAGALRSYFTRINALRDVVGVALEKQEEKLWWVLRAPVLPARFWPLLRHVRHSADDVMQRLFGDDEAVKLALCGHLTYYTDRLDQIWFPFYALAQASYHRGGAHFVRGGSQAIVERLVAVIREAGGVAETGRRATRFTVADGRVTGVEHEAAKPVDGHRDERREQAPVVFANLSPRAFAPMLPEALGAKLRERYERRPLSVSLWTIGLGFDRKVRELGVERYSTTVFPEWFRSVDDLAVSAALMREPPDGRLPHFVFVDYSRFDGALGPEPPYLASMGGLDRAENWTGLSPEEDRDRRKRWTDRMVAELERQYPGLESSLVQAEMTTARSIEGYLGTPGGAAYGFSPAPPRHRFFTPKTPVPGLYLASAWGGLGGYSGSLMTGSSAANTALKAS